MLANVNPDDFTTAHESEMDAQLLVRFFYKEREDKVKTKEEGRPIYKEVEYCEIRVRGNRDPQACRPATHADRMRFPRHYEAFKKRVELPEEGTPLAEWPQISRTQIEELSFLNIKTVEQLSKAADTHIGKFRGGYTLKQRATDWLTSSNATALIANNEALKAQIKALESKVERLLNASDAAAANPQAQLTPSALDTDAAGDVVYKEPQQRVGDIQIPETEEAPAPVKRASRRKKS